MLIVHLDEPGNPSTHFSDCIALQAWCVVSGCQELDRTLPEVEVLIERLGSASITRNDATLSGEHLLHADQINGIKLDQFSLKRVQPSPVTMLRGEGRMFSIRGQLRLTSQVPDGGEAPAEFRLALILTHGGCTTISNIVQFAIPARSAWEEPYGGFLFPTTALFTSRFLELRGWAVRKNDELVSVDLKLGGKSVGNAQRGIWSPEQYAALGGLEESRRCIFERTFFSEELQKQGLLLFVDGESIPVEATCRFRSGRELSLRAHDLVWKIPDEEIYESELSVRGHIERVALNASGRVEVEGWVFSEHMDSCAFLLQGIHRAVTITKNGMNGDELSFRERTDITAKFLPWAKNERYGFLLQFNPLILGRFPGVVRLVVEERGKRTAIGPSTAWWELSRLISESAFHRNGMERAVALSTRFVSALGMRRGVKREMRSSEQRKAANSRPRLLVATHNLSPTEGAPKVLAHVLNRFTSGLPEANVLLYSPSDGGLRRSIATSNLEIEIEPALSTVHQTWERYHATLVALTERIAHFGPQLIYANTVDSFWAIEVARRLRIPAIWAIHESWPVLDCFPQLDSRLRLHFLERLRDPEKFIFVSHASRNVFLPFIGGQATTVIPNGVDLHRIDQLRVSLEGVDLRRRLAIDAGEKVVSIIGTTAPHKAQDVFLQGMKRLVQRAPELRFRFFIVGARESEYTDSLRELTRSLGLENSVEFVPETEEVAQYFLVSNVVVLASKEESAPLVSLEAFASRVPLVTTAVFGLAEQVEDGVTALVYPVGDAEKLAAKVYEVLTNERLSRELVENARRRVEKQFSIAPPLERYWNEIVPFLREKLSERSPFDSAGNYCL